MNKAYEEVSMFKTHKYFEWKIEQLLNSALGRCEEAEAPSIRLILQILLSLNQ